MEASLYERLGGTEGIKRIISDEVDLHAANPRIAPRFADLDLDALKASATAFVITGTVGRHVMRVRTWLLHTRA